MFDYSRRIAFALLLTLVAISIPLASFAQQDSARIYEQNGRTALQQGDNRTAELNFRSALRFDSLNYPALRNLALILTNAHMNEEALRYLLRAERSGKSDASLHNAMGLLYERVGEFNRSASYHKRAVEAEPGNYDYNRDFGAALLSGGKFAESARQLDKALELNPTDAETQFLAGNAHAGQDSVMQAIKRYELALELGHDIGALRYNLGIALEQIGDIYKAEEHLSFAVAHEPDSINYRQRLAVFFLRANVTKQAIKHFREILKRDRANLNAIIGLGAAHALEGSVDSAYSHLGYVRRIDTLRAAMMSRMIENNLVLRQRLDSAANAAQSGAGER